MRRTWWRKLRIRFVRWHPQSGGCQLAFCGTRWLLITPYKGRFAWTAYRADVFPAQDIRQTEILYSSRRAAQRAAKAWLLKEVA